jgi:hypothetical protein
MKTQVVHAHSLVWYLAVAALLIAALMFFATRPAAQVGSRTVEQAEAFSFDMWCLEMKLYPVSRCDARSSDDVKAYERYRATVEQYTAQRSAQQKREQELRDRLNRDPTAVKR